MAILTSKKIREEMKNNHIKITDFDKDRLGPNSYDLTLFKKISYYSDDKYLDTKNPCQELETFEIPENGITLFPKRLYLCKTNETVWSDKYIMELSGLSSLARLGIVVHQTAGYANIGHEFQWVLEVTVTLPVKIYPNMRIAQQYFHTVEGDVEFYNGRYKYKQLDDDICPSIVEYDPESDPNSKHDSIDAFIEAANALQNIGMNIAKDFGFYANDENIFKDSFSYESISSPYNGESLKELIENTRVIDISETNKPEEK